MIDLLAIDLNWKEEDWLVILPVFLTITGYSIYWFILKSHKIRHSFYSRDGSCEASRKHILFTKYVGVMTMGVLPLVFVLLWMPGYGLKDIGISLNAESWNLTVYSILGLSTIIVPVTYLSGKNPEMLKNYPEIRSKEWTVGMVIQYGLAWAFYLLAYEILFRGILLFPLVDALGIWPAIVVNMALVSTMHIPKGLGETIGSPLMSLVLCWLTIKTGNIWTAFIVHIMVAWTNCFTALKYHPEMKLVRPLIKTEEKSI
jgi:membrane protease YdiL (CAAX protease family)